MILLIIKVHVSLNIKFLLSRLYYFLIFYFVERIKKKKKKNCFKTFFYLN